MVAKKHDIDMLADWAKSWGIEGYEHYSPAEREKRRQHAIKQFNAKQRRNNNESNRRHGFKRYT